MDLDTLPGKLLLGTGVDWGKIKDSLPRKVYPSLVVQTNADAASRRGGPIGETSGINLCVAVQKSQTYYYYALIIGPDYVGWV